MLSCSTFVSLLILFSGNEAYSADYFKQAVKIFSEGKFFEASIEFERAIYYERDSGRIAKYKYYKCLCYKMLENYDRALDELNSINMNSLQDSMVLVLKYEKILCSFLNKDLNQALRNIDEVEERYQDTLKIMEFIPLEILCLNSCRQWNKALVLWKFLIRNSQLEDSSRVAFKTEIEKLYDKRNLPGICSPVKAARMSALLPGLGQLYCGAIGEGAFSFLLNAASLYISVSEFCSEYYCTGYFFLEGLFGRFYRGGINRAKNLAIARNEDQIRKFNARSSSLMSGLFNDKPAGSIPSLSGNR